MVRCAYRWSKHEKTSKNDSHDWKLRVKLYVPTNKNHKTLSLFFLFLKSSYTPKIHRSAHIASLVAPNHDYRSYPISIQDDGKTYLFHKLTCNICVIGVSNDVADAIACPCDGECLVIYGDDVNTK